MTESDIDFIARVQVAQERSKWSWRYLRTSPANLIVLLGITLDDDPYRSPHSSAGNITLCDGIPAPSCTTGGWWYDGRCLREEEDCPHDAPCVPGTHICSLRKQGVPALSAQVSRDPYSPGLRKQTAGELHIREWFRRALKAALVYGDEHVAAGARAYIDHEAPCTAADSRALALWLYDFAAVMKPWHPL